MNCPKCQAPIDPGTPVCLKCGHALATPPAEEPAGNAGLAVVGGLGGALLGAVVWFVVRKYLNVESGFIAWGVGLAAGFGVVLIGRGRGPVFQMIGAGTALFGLILGKLLIFSFAFIETDLEDLKSGLRVMDPTATAEQIDEMARTLLEKVQKPGFIDFLKEDSSFIDIIFVVLAVMTGWGIPRLRGGGGE